MSRSIVFWLFGILLIVVGLAWWNLRVNTLRINPPLSSQDESDQPVIEPKSPAQITIFPDDPVLGARLGYQVTIVEFSDFECPYCQTVSPLLKQIVEKYAGKIRLVWKDLPLPNHINSPTAAIAAQCASAQGKFWQYHDGLFANQVNLGFALYNTLAGNLGLDQFLFSTCLDSRKPSALINKNAQEAEAIGVEGVPYLIINGRPINGVPSWDELQATVEEAMQ